MRELREKFSKDFKDLYSYQAHYFNHDDFCQHYIDEGQGEEVIVMVHGNPTWSFYYRHLIDKFKSKYRVIVPDHMGHGFSTKPQKADYSLKNRVKHLKDLLAHLKVDKFHLVVHDWGGAIGTGLAVEDPDRVLSLAITNTAAWPDANIPSRISLCRLPVVGEWLVRGLNGFAWPATFMTTHNPLSQKVKDAYLYPYYDYENRVSISRFVQDIPMEKNHPTREYLGSIAKKLTTLNCPKIIFWGGEDFCFNDHFYNEWSKMYGDAQKHYFEDAGHYVLEDKKDFINQTYASFLDSIH